MSSSPELNESLLWQQISALWQRFDSAEYWTERRDACETGFEIAQQIAALLRKAGVDSDADVAHWGNQFSERLSQISTQDNETLWQQTSQLLDERCTSAETPETITTEPNELMPSSPPSTLIDRAAIEAWLPEFAAQQEAQWQASASGGSVTFTLEGGRRQKVMLDFRGRDRNEQPIALIYTICGKASDKDLEWALKMNPRLKRGHFGVIEQNGQPMLVLMMRRRMGEVALEELGNHLVYLANKGDDAEARLGEEDLF